MNSQKPSIVKFPGHADDKSVKGVKAVFDWYTFSAWLQAQAGRLRAIALIGLTIGAVVGIFKGWQAHRINHYVAEYAKCSTLADQVAWAKLSVPSQLSNLQAFVFLRQAHEYEHKGEWSDALECYRQAKTYGTLSPLKEQARMGYAFIALQLDQLDAAEAEFKTLYQGPLNYLKAQALYGLCFIAHRRENGEQLKRYLQQLQTLKEGAVFLRQWESFQAND
ncbi:MAG TPA: hypothetical protein DEW74_02640 [Opitutae bacterium]|nr:hypothetical protein [Opitutae bacterium]